MAKKSTVNKSGNYTKSFEENSNEIEICPQKNT